MDPTNASATRPSWSRPKNLARYSLRGLCTAFTLLLSTSLLLASDAGTVPPVVQASPDPVRIRVGVAGSAPFVNSRDGALTGLSVGVFREVARTAQLAYDLEPFNTVDGALLALEGKQLDAVIGPISITSARAQRVDFTQPYFHASLGILAPPEDGGFIKRLSPFLTHAFLVGTATLLLVLTIVGTLVWLTERKKNPQMFPRSPLRGIGNGIWFGLVTMTTVGYGDRVPLTAWGRVVSGVWMVIAMLTVSSLTAGIATALTVAQLDRGSIGSIEQVDGLKVAALEGTSSVGFAREYGARVVTVATLDQAVGEMASGGVAAIVHDRPILEYYLSRHPETDATLAKASYRPQGYGFAVRLGSDLQRRLSVALLTKAEDRSIQRITKRWLSGGTN